MLFHLYRPSRAPCEAGRLEAAPLLTLERKQALEAQETGDAKSHQRGKLF